MTELRAVDHAALSKKLQRGAEECRALALMMTSAANAATYLCLAKTYDAAATQADQRAQYRKDQPQKVGPPELGGN
jgi:hypothetical protein